MVVTEYFGHCVSVFRPNGERLRYFGTHGSGQGQFEYPTGVAVDADGNILVADCYNHRIQKFSADGQFLAAVGTCGISPLQFISPVGVAVNKINNKVYVVEWVNYRVQVLNSDLTFSSTFGTEGTGLSGHGVLPVTTLGLCIYLILTITAYKFSQLMESS